MSRISWDQWVHRPRKTDCTWSIFLEDGIKRDLNGNAAPEEHTEMGNKINSSQCLEYHLRLPLNCYEPWSNKNQFN